MVSVVSETRTIGIINVNPVALTASSEKAAKREAIAMTRASRPNNRRFQVATCVELPATFLGSALKVVQPELDVLIWKRPSDEMPDSDETVLLSLTDESEPVWPGYYDGETWRTAEGTHLDDSAVLAWAQMPAGIAGHPERSVTKSNGPGATRKRSAA